MITNCLPSSEPPKINPFSFPPRKAIGSIVTVTCSISSGSHPLNFLWFKDGQELEPQSDVDIATMKTSSFLEVSKVQESHEGNYTCQVSNSIGSDSFSARLEVEGESSTH